MVQYMVDTRDKTTNVWTECYGTYEFVFVVLEAIVSYLNERGNH